MAGGEEGIDTGVAKDAAYHIWDIVRRGTTHQYFYIDDILKATQADTDYITTVDLEIWIRTWVVGVTVTADWVLERLYCNPEPTWGAWGSQESAPAVMAGALEIRLPTGELVGVLKDAFNIMVEESTNAPPILTFSLPADDFRLADITRSSELWVWDVEESTLIGKFRLARKDDQH